MGNSAIRFYTLEYVDDEGEEVIKQVYLTQEEALEFIRKMAESGISVKLYDLTSPQSDDAQSTVMLTDGSSGTFDE